MLVLVGGLLVVVLSVAATGAQAAQSPYFPMTLGSQWVYEKYGNILDTVLGQETARIDDVRLVCGQMFYHLSTPWLPSFSCWVRGDSIGDIYRCDSPGAEEKPLFLFSRPYSEPWSPGQMDGHDFAQTVPCGWQITPPQGSYDDAICMFGGCLPPACYDIYWSGAFARDIGPVWWAMIGVGGAAIEYRLLEYLPGPESVCRCHGDPVCDGVTNVRDVVSVIDVAFRGTPPIRPRGCSWYARSLHGAGDVDCSGETNIIDVVMMIDVALRGASAESKFCHP